MKKRLVYLLSISILSCNTLGGKRGISDSIEESKEIGTYLKEFEIFADTLGSHHIKHIWAEYAWNYPYTFKERRIRKERQTLIIEFDLAQLEGKYDTTWALQDISEKEIHYFNPDYRYKQLFCETGNYLQDTIHLNLVRGDLLKDKIDSKQEIILVAKPLVRAIQIH